MFKKIQDDLIMVAKLAGANYSTLSIDSKGNLSVMHFGSRHNSSETIADKEYSDRVVKINRITKKYGSAPVGYLANNIHKQSDIDNELTTRVKRVTTVRLTAKVKALRELKASTASIDYKCGFKDGKCKKHRHNEYSSALMCCCSGCYSCSGYLQDYPKFNTITAKDLPLVKALFKPLTGFWKEGVGCTLPRELRSKVCINFNCSGIDPILK